MKKHTIITYLLASTLLLSACVGPFTPGGESMPPHSDTSASFSENITPSEIVESSEPESDASLSSIPYDINDVGVLGENYIVGPYTFREFSFSHNGEVISGLTLYSYSGNSEIAVIPSKVNDIPVIAIGYRFSVFDFNSAVKQIVIPDTVQYIGNNAFRYCANLTDLTLPSGIKYIGAWPFDGCPGLKEIRITADMQVNVQSLFGATGLKKVILDEGVTFMPTLMNCSSLEELQLPSTITRLCSTSPQEFAGCGLKFLELPEGLTMVGGYDFDGSKIERIIFPSTLSEIGGDFFNGVPIKEVFFRGTKEQCIQDLQDYLDEINVPIYYLSETEPTEEGNFWHYVDGKPVIW